MCWNKISTAGKINDVLVLGLIATMLTYIVIAFTHPNFNPANFQNFFGQGAKGATGWIEAVPNAMTGFGSIVAVAFLVGSVENPKKNVPKATIIALLLVSCLYMLMIISTMGHVTTQFLIDNPGMRFIPMFAAAFTSMSNLPWLPSVISIAALLALITTMLVVLNLTANAMKAMADDGFLPKFLTSTTKANTPKGALIVVTVLCCVLTCFPEWTEILVNLGSLFAAMNISLVILSAIPARKKTTIDPDAFTAPGGNVVSIITVVGIFCTYIPKLFGAGNGTMWAFCIGLYIVGYVFLTVCKKKNG